MPTTIKILIESDATAYRELRLLSFQESQLAFSERYEDEQHKSADDFFMDINAEGNPAEKFALGAFTDDGVLAGILTFKRDKRTKARHKAMKHAMYTHPDHRNEWRRTPIAACCYRNGLDT